MINNVGNYRYITKCELIKVKAINIKRFNHHIFLNLELSSFGRTLICFQYNALIYKITVILVTSTLSSVGIK